jgi:hypothetical protein
LYLKHKTTLSFTRRTQSNRALLLLFATTPISLLPCRQARYPPKLEQQRLQRAVWRGSNTDRRVLLMDESNVLDVMRTRLHMFGRWYPDTIDAHYTGFSQQAFAGNCIGELMPPGMYVSCH